MRSLLFSFLILILCSRAIAGSASLPYQDDEFGCFSQAEANRYIADFNVDEASFGGLELCDSRKDTKKLLNDLSLIERSEFSQDSSHNLIRGFVSANNYYSWMKSETRGMQRGNDLPFATAYNSGGYFTMQDGWAALSTLGRVGTVIHEARHTEGFRHYPCSHGPYAGASTAGCDTSYSQGGSHAVEMEYYARVVLNSKNLHPVYKSMARLMALGRSNFVFNQTPIRAREALLAKTDAKLLLLDGETMFERALPEAAKNFTLKRTSFGASLVKESKALALDLYAISNGGALVKDDYSYYKLFQTSLANPPREIHSIEEIDVGERRFFAVLGEQGKVYSYDFPNGAWARASNPLSGAQSFVTHAPDGSAGLFVVKSDGAILPFNLLTRTYGAPLRDRWLSGVRSYTPYGKDLLKLLADGSVVNASSGSPVREWNGVLVNELVAVPLYDAFEVDR